jgi:hypothetical protein
VAGAGPEATEGGTAMVPEGRFYATAGQQLPMGEQRKQATMLRAHPSPVSHILLSSVLLLSTLCGCGGGNGASDPVDSSEAGSSSGAGSPDAGPIIVVDRDAQTGEHPGAEDAVAPSMDAKAPRNDAAAPVEDAGEGGWDAALHEDGGDVDSAALVDALAPETGSPTCSSGSLSCNGVCVPSDVHDCGTCGHDCTNLPHVSGSTGCSASGACVIGSNSCAAGWADCDGNPDDGCETDMTQPGHCGSCTTACPASDPVCSGSGSSYACVTGCPSGAPTRCSGSCVDVQSDDGNCGGCGMACQGGEHCVSGACACADGQHLCGSPATCVDETVSACGPSCQVCTAPAHASPYCDGSACQWSCSTGYTGCPTANPTACDALGSDSSNCGACGHACTGGETCQAGVCACPAGQTLCGATCVNEASDGSNCGACGHSCLGGACSGGACQPVEVTSGATGPIVVDTGNVYFAGANGMYGCPKTGCSSPTLLYSTTANIFDLVYDSGTPFGDRLYATVEGADSVEVMQYTQGAPDFFSSTIPYPTGLANGADAVYVGTQVATIVAATKGSGAFGTITTIASHLPAPVGPVALDAAASIVYGGVQATAGSIVRVATTSTGAFTTFAPNQANPVSIAIASGNVYWADFGTSADHFQDGAVYMCATGATCSASTRLGGGSYCGSVSTDSASVYFICSSSLYRCPLAGCGAGATVLATVGPQQGAQVINDATAVYWTETSGAVMKLAK